MDKNDESVGQTDENNSSQLEKDDDIIQMDELAYNESNTSKSLEEVTTKSSEESSEVSANPIQQNQDNISEKEENGRRSPSPCLLAASQDKLQEQTVTSRPSRTRKTPKRIYEPDPSPEPPKEKRPKRIMERRKSVGGLVLREYMQQNNISLDENDAEPQIPTSVITSEGVADLADIRLEQHKLGTRSISPRVNFYGKPSPIPHEMQTEEIWAKHLSYTQEASKQQQQQPQRIVTRRKSVGGLVLKEYMQQNNIDVDEISNEPADPQIPSHVVKNQGTSSYPEQVQQNSSYAGQLYQYPTDPRIMKNKADLKANAHETNNTSKPVTVDMATLTDNLIETEEKGIQCDEQYRCLDDEFLETLRPQIKNMNFRQKINFKQRVYLALMDVLDDAKNFPTDEQDVVELPVPLAKHFESTTSGELRLMRELVSLVQAAKVSSEVVNASDKVTVVATPVTPSSNGNDAQLSPVANGDDEAPIEIEDDVPPRTESISVRSTDSLGIPRHILHKAVKVTGNNGGTLMAQSGDKRRIYRIFPKTPLISSSSGSTATSTGEKTTNTQSPTTGTFFVTPPKSQIKVSTTTGSVTLPLVMNKSPQTPLMKGTAIQYPKIIKPNAATPTQTISPMLPPSSTKSPVLSNGVNSTLTAQKVSINTHVPSANIFRRRYSICGPATSGTSSPIVQSRLTTASAKPSQQLPQQISQPKNMLHQQLKMKQQALLHQPLKGPHLPIKFSSPIPSMQQVIQRQQPQLINMQQKMLQTQQQRSLNHISPPKTSMFRSSTNIQISKPVSLNSTAEKSSNEPESSSSSALKSTDISDSNKDTLAEATTSDDLLSNPPIPVLETAGVIAADSFDSDYSKNPYIKLEPEE